MAEEAQNEVPVQAAEEQPVAEEHVAQEPAAEAAAAAEPVVDATEQVADAAVEADQADAGLKRSREEEQEGDGEEPDAKRAAGDAPADVNGGVEAEAPPALDAFPAEPVVQPFENGTDNPGHDNPGIHEAAPAPVYGNPGQSMESNLGSGGPPPVREGFSQVQNEDGSISEVLAVSKHLVGKLIGKGGTTIQQLQGTTATNVQIDQEGTDLGPDVKRVTIRGRADNVAKCKDAIKQMLEEAVAPQGETEEKVTCPPGIVGRVIGRGGETIRSLQQGSGAHILVDQNYPEGQDRMVVIKGRPDCVIRAKAMVEELIKGEPGSASQIISKHGVGVTLTVQCPKGIVGRIIGKGGETIKGLQRKYHVSIQIDQGGDPMNVTITGPKQTAEYCKQEIQSLIADPGPPFGGPGPRGGGGGPGGFGGPRPYGGSPYGGPAPYAPPPAYGGYAPPYGAPYAAPYAAPAYPGYPPTAAPYAAGGYGAAAGYGNAYGAAAAYPGAAQPAAGGYAQPAQAAAGGYGQQQYGADAGAAAGGYQAPAAAAPVASSVWQAMSDDQGRTYYYNTQTGVSQWEKPAEMP
eukprot:GHUV01002426.1.p1 GENE.GHUV01002426.1~~GHUV01002426.1.p1  ORF type:complete len:574 (+),score=218.02 GHUV01002426.1:84-1805(+)